METVILNIDGMTCGGCAKSVERALGDLAGVASVNADWQNGTAQVQFDAAQTDLAALVEAVEDAGFEVQAA